MNIALNHSAGRARRATRLHKSSHQQTPVTSRITRRALVGVGFCATLVGIGALTESLTSQNAALAGALLSIIAIIQMIRPRRRQSITATHVGPQAVAGAVIRGCVLGLIFAALMAALAPLARFIPTPATWTDRDRPAVEQQIATLAAAGNDEAAAAVVEKRLAGRLSATWRGELEQRHVDLLVSAGEAAATPEAQATLWRRAAAIAADYGRDDRLPLALLSTVDATRAHQQAVSQFAHQYDRQLRDFLTDVSRVELPAARDVVLRAITKYVPKSQWPDSLPQSLVDNLLHWSDVAVSLTEKRTHLQTAVAECARWEIDAKLAQLQLTAVEQELARLAPIILPAGSRARLISSHAEGEPAVAFDVTVESAAGQAITDLSNKDFAVTSSGRRIAAQQISRVLHSTATDLSVVMLLDYSASTQNVRGAAQSGAIALTSSAPRGTQFRVLAFHNEVVAVTDWTDRFTEIDSRLRAFQASGPRTALRKAIAIAIAELAARSGARVLVIFTDGRDTTGAIVNDAELIAQCRAKGVRVMAIGLENGELDAALLVKLAEGTGGQYFAASKQEELVERFRGLRLEQTTPVYRVAILTTPTMRWPLELTIGGGAHTLRIDLPRTVQR